MRFYRALLYLYPASFRAEYGEELCACFARQPWTTVLADVLCNAPAAHFDILRKDLAYTVRTLRRSPGFTVTAIAVTAIGIGATTAAFTLTDHVLLRPLPFADASRLVKIWEDHRAQGIVQLEPSPANFHDWQRGATSFEAMGAYAGASVNLTGGAGEPERLEGAGVTYGMLPMLGVQPEIGRLFTADDDREGAPPTVVLSDGVWRRRFGGDSKVIGSVLSFDDVPHKVIGVMPAAFLSHGAVLAAHAVRRERLCGARQQLPASGRQTEARCDHGRRAGRNASGGGAHRTHVADRKSASERDRGRPAR
jgi:hypothetical protein